MTDIAFLGLGAMGERMARRLLEAGHRLTVHNRTPARAESLVDAGARWAATPREAVEEAEVVWMMVRDDRASQDLWLDAGALDAMPRTALAIESSTLTPAWTRRLEGAFRERGRSLLEAPVVGTRPHAESGSLTFLVGGEASALERARPLLEALGQAIHPVGPVGHAAALKLAVNTLFAGQVALLAELLGYLERTGPSAAASMEVLGSLAVTSPAAKAAGAGMVAERWAPLFPVELTHKDLVCLTESASAERLETPASDAVRAVYARAIGAGLSDENLHAVAKLYR